MSRISDFWGMPQRLASIEAKLDSIIKGETKIMAGVVDVQNAETTLHQDLVAQNGLIKQILAAVASGNLTSAQAQALVDQMNADDADAKSNVTAITAALAALTGGAPAGGGTGGTA